MRPEPRRLAGRHLHVRAHAVRRLEEHFRCSTIGDALLAVGTGEEVAPELAAALTGRRVPARRGCSRYVLHPAGTGMFVLIPTQDGALEVVTYLRFGFQQQAMVKGWWSTKAVLPGSNAVAGQLHEPALKVSGVAHEYVPDPMVHTRRRTMPPRRRLAWSTDAVTAHARCERRAERSR